jgi:hypothetical protein
MRPNERIEAPAKRPKRSGIPLVVYFGPEQARQLQELSESRHVSKATIVRVAVAQFCQQFEAGQLQPPIGIEDRR